MGKNEKPDQPQTPLARLPWLVNGSLPVNEREQVEDALLRDDDGAEALTDMQRLANSIRRQDQAPLPDSAWAAIRSRTGLSPKVSELSHAERPMVGLPRRARSRRASLASLALAFSVALLVAGALWAALRPGTHVAWTAQSDEAVTFLVYRGNPETESFELWRELPAAPDGAHYELVDHRPATGPTAYRIEAVSQGQLIAFRETIVAGGWGVMLNQLAILLLAFVVAAAALRWEQESSRAGGLRLARS